MARLGLKARGCLAMVYALHDRNNSAAWQNLYDEACAAFSEKAVNLKFEELARRGYLDCGVSARTGWLTEKGKAALFQSRLSERGVVSFGG